MVKGIPASVSSIPLSPDTLFTFTVSHPTCPATHTDSTNLSHILAIFDKLFFSLLGVPNSSKGGISQPYPQQDLLR